MGRPLFSGCISPFMMLKWQPARAEQLKDHLQMIVRKERWRGRVANPPGRSGDGAAFALPVLDETQSLLAHKDTIPRQGHTSCRRQAQRIP